MSRNARTLGMLVGVVLTMGALAWAAVPFYSWFCRVTGYGGTTAVATAATGEVLDRTIRIHFDANVDPGLPWRFRPAVPQMTVRIGETALAYYTAENLSPDETITGTASYNVAPEQAGSYFDKIQCFCFTEQTLKPGERVEMPVSFFVDPELARDVDTTRINDITLSYTFHRTPGAAPRVEARVDVAPVGAVN